MALLSAWVIYPLAWIVRLARGREGRPTPPLGHLAPWVALLSGLVALAFCIGLVVVTAGMVQANDMLILVGIAAKYRWLFILPLTFDGPGAGDAVPGGDGRGRSGRVGVKYISPC